jgi:hypothetical protein
VTNPSRPIPNNLGWGIAGLILFWPVGLFALIKAIKVGSLSAAGDTAGAQASSDSAKKLGKIAVIVGAVLIVLYCLIFVVIGAMMSSTS